LATGSLCLPLPEYRKTPDRHDGFIVKGRCRGRTKKQRPADLRDPSGEYAVGEYGVQLFALSTFVNAVASVYQTETWQQE